MNKMGNKVTLLNMGASLILQICTIISGFVIPHIILVYFGSEVNGLISSITQFLSYISLVEGGVGSVIMANLYKPLTENNTSLISSILVTADKFYKKIGFIFIIYSIILSVIYPIIFHTDFSCMYVCLLVLILSLGTTIQYMFAINIKTLLNADKKVYVVSFLQSAIVILNIVLVFIVICVYPNIHLLKLLTAFAYSLQPVFFHWYIKKHYCINWKEKKNNNLIKGRWNGFAINTAAFIHNCTDIAILTVFTDLKTVSIYAVYSLVTNGIKQIISSLTNGINPTIGQAYASGNERDLNKKMDAYEYIVLSLTSFMYTLTALLITPFVMIYTRNIIDTDYYQPIFGVLLVISEAIYIVKFPHLNLAYSANKFKEITIPAYIEAIINVSISIILVYKFGLIGVTIGTIIAMIYRMIFHVYFTSTFVKGRKQSEFYKKLILFLMISILSFLFGYFVFPIRNFTLINWVIHAFAYCCILLILIIGTSVTVFKKEMSFFIKYVRK